jgi:hypothetical protein
MATRTTNVRAPARNAVSKSIAPAMRAAAVPKTRSQAVEAMRLPFDTAQWPESDFLAPIAFLRSALFGIVPKGRRTTVKDLSVATYGGLELRFSGDVFDQYDHDLWLVAVRLAREHGMGMNVHFSQRAILNALGWDTGGKSIKRLRSSFSRLVKATIEIQGKGGALYLGHLIDEVVFTKNPADAEDSYYFRLSPKMAKSFAPDQTALLVYHRDSFCVSDSHCGAPAALGIIRIGALPLPWPHYCCTERTSRYWCYRRLPARPDDCVRDGCQTRDRAGGLN